MIFFAAPLPSTRSPWPTFSARPEAAASSPPGGQCGGHSWGVAGLGPPSLELSVWTGQAFTTRSGVRHEPRRGR